MAATFATKLLGWRRKSARDARLVANCVDVSSDQSMDIAAEMLRNLGVKKQLDSWLPKDPGRALELEVANSLRSQLEQLAPQRSFEVPAKSVKITEFLQYQHLQEVDRLADTPALRVTLGQDYLISPDVCVTMPARGSKYRFLQAAVSCKWTIRSDRVQNIRHESVQMIRHRRARLPHLPSVTAEPLPTRLESISRGTGEVDSVYHIAFAELDRAIRSVGNAEQLDAWEEAIGQGRIVDFAELATVIADW